METITAMVSVDIPVDVEIYEDGRHVAASVIMPRCFAVGKDVPAVLARFKQVAEDWIDMAGKMPAYSGNRNPEPPTP